MRFKIEEFNRNVPDDDLLSDVRRVATTLGKDKLTTREYNDHGKYHVTTLTQRFSSWFNVLDRVGLKHTRNLNISNNDLFENLVEVWTKLGRQPRYNDLIPGTSRYSSDTYARRFRTWHGALLSFSDWANSEQRLEPNLNPTDKSQGRRTPRNINWRLRAQILMRDGAICRLCGARPTDGIRLHVDHILPWSKGGETLIENLQILCEKCNVGKSDLTAS
jgi:Homing endonuclease associated repeat/HNH endonuclease